MPRTSGCPHVGMRRTLDRPPRAPYHKNDSCYEQHEDGARRHDDHAQEPAARPDPRDPPGHEEPPDRGVGLRAGCAGSSRTSAWARSTATSASSSSTGSCERIDFGSTVDRYEANIHAHHHFVCERCGAVADLEVPVDESLTRKLGQAAGVKADRHEIRLYGICAACARKG